VRLVLAVAGRSACTPVFRPLPGCALIGLAVSGNMRTGGEGTVFVGAKARHLQREDHELAKEKKGRFGGGAQRIVVTPAPQM